MKTALRKTLWGGILILALGVLEVGADIVQPVSVQLKEQEPNSFLVQWQVPKRFPLRAMPEPVLPEHCQARGERILQDQPGTWLNRQNYRCPDGLAGQRVGIRYPFINAGQTTMLRIDFLSGEQLVQALGPGEEWWQVPEIDAGVLGNPWPNVRRAVVDGIGHFLGGWLHLGLWLAIALLGGVRASVRLATAFAVAQIVAVSVSAGVGYELPAVLAECGIAVAVVLLVRESLRPAGARRQLTGLAVAAGFVHGLGLASLLPTPPSFEGLGWLYLVLTVVGMDSTLLVLALVAAWVHQSAAGHSWAGRLSRGLSYTLGGIAVAATLVLVLVHPTVEAKAERNTRLPNLAGADGGTGMPGSRRVAPQGPQAPIQSFLTIEAFEVRHEILVRLLDIAEILVLDPEQDLEVQKQADVKAAVEALVVPMVTATIDGATASPIVDRVDFLTVGTQGVLPRPEPVVERISEAFVGVTVVYLTSRTPSEVELSWGSFVDGIPEIPATVSDPEFSQTMTLTAETPALSWQNNLSDDPTPMVAAVAVEPRALPIPLVSLPLFVVAAFLGVAAIRGRHPAVNSALARVVLAVALIAAPLGEVAVALPAAVGSVPSTGEARRILAGVLPNVYRAFEFRQESDAYDRLAVSVTGATLSDIYLEHRRALHMEERGGARARVEAVEVPEVRSVRPAADGGFEVETVWVVGGTVTHFGHRHFRQNRYDAQVTLVPVDSTWKIRSIELFDEERIR